MKSPLWWRHRWIFPNQTNEIKTGYTVWWFSFIEPDEIVVQISFLHFMERNMMNTHTYTSFKSWHRGIICVFAVCAQVHQGLAELWHGGLWPFLERPRRTELRLNPLHEVAERAEALRLRYPQDQRSLWGEPGLSVFDSVVISIILAAATYSWRRCVLQSGTCFIHAMCFFQSGGPGTVSPQSGEQ